VKQLTSLEDRLGPAFSFFWKLLLSAQTLAAPRTAPPLELFPDEDTAECCFLLTIGSTMPRASAKLAPEQNKISYCLLAPQEQYLIPTK
jgi:hypothetical protein